jgi:hypothetical protein
MVCNGGAAIAVSASSKCFDRHAAIQFDKLYMTPLYGQCRPIDFPMLLNLTSKSV